MPEINTELFNQIADLIEGSPDLYDQNDWTNQTEGCGTTHCIAGWALTLTNNNHNAESMADWPAYYETPLEERPVHGAIGVAAAQALGLDPREADNLFHTDWKPPQNITVPEALRKIGGGDPIPDLTDPAISEYINRSNNNMLAEQLIREL